MMAHAIIWGFGKRTNPRNLFAGFLLRDGGLEPVLDLESDAEQVIE